MQSLYCIRGALLAVVTSGTLVAGDTVMRPSRPDAKHESVRAEVSDAIVGAWGGGTNATGRWYFAEVRISSDKAGNLRGTLDVAGAQAAGIVLDSLRVTGDQVSFRSITPIGTIAFEGTLSGPTIDGAITGGAPSARMHLARLTPGAPAYTDSIAGAYEIDDKQQLFLTPHANGILSAFVVQHRGNAEALGRTLLLLPRSHDEFVSSGSVVTALKLDETFVVQRGVRGAISGIVWKTPEGSSRTLKRTNFAAQHSVNFPGVAGNISGTLFTPGGVAPHPAVLLVAGSGPTARDNLLLRVREFLKLNMAVLALDKRGVGDTDGDYFDSSFEQYADDAAAALNWLRAQPGIDASRVGVHGHSQGGWVAPWAAMKAAKPPAWMIITSGGPVPPIEQEAWRASTQAKAAGATDADARAAEAFIRQKWEYGYHGGDWNAYYRAAQKAFAAPWGSIVSPVLSPEPKAWSFIRRLANYDPMTVAVQLKMPVLILFGDQDDEQPRVLAEAKWREAFKTSGNNSFTIATISGVPHSLWIRNGTPRTLVSTPTEMIGAWLKQR